MHPVPRKNSRSGSRKRTGGGAQKPARKARSTGQAAARRSRSAGSTARSRRSTADKAAGARPRATRATRGSSRSPSGLTARDLEYFRGVLLRKRAELLGDVATLQDEALSKSRQEAAGNLSHVPSHMADVGSDHYEQEFTLGLIEGERALLREIEEALTRIEQGTYGICVATGKPIGKARLKARPWAKYCYEYTLAQERSQGAQRRY